MMFAGSLCGENDIHNREWESQKYHIALLDLQCPASLLNTLLEPFFSMDPQHTPKTLFLRGRAVSVKFRLKSEDMILYKFCDPADHVPFIDVTRISAH